MIKNMIMPKMGDSMEEGSIERWLVKKGDFVKKGQLVMEVATDKAVLEVESLVEGEVLKIIVLEGQAVPVGTTVAYVGENGDLLPDDDTGPGKEESEAASRQLSVPDPTAPVVVQGQKSRSQARISPRAAGLARQLGVDISKVVGTGPKGRIKSEDVKRFHENQA